LVRILGQAGIHATRLVIWPGLDATLRDDGNIIIPGLETEIRPTGGQSSMCGILGPVDCQRNMVTRVFWSEDARAGAYRDHNPVVVNFPDSRSLWEIVAFRGMVIGAISSLGDFCDCTEWFDPSSKLNEI